MKGEVKLNEEKMDKTKYMVKWIDVPPYLRPTREQLMEYFISEKRKDPMRCVNKALKSMKDPSKGCHAASRLRKKLRDPSTGKWHYYFLPCQKPRLESENGDFMFYCQEHYKGKVVTPLQYNEKILERNDHNKKVAMKQQSKVVKRKVKAKKPKGSYKKIDKHLYDRPETIIDPLERHVVHEETVTIKVNGISYGFCMGDTKVPEIICIEDDVKVSRVGEFSGRVQMIKFIDFLKSFAREIEKESIMFVASKESDSGVAARGGEGSSGRGTKGGGGTEPSAAKEKKHDLPEAPDPSKTPDPSLKPGTRW